jgi:hypothetical protein
MKLFIICLFSYFTFVQQLYSQNVIKGAYKTTFVKDTVSNYYYNISAQIIIDSTVYPIAEQHITSYFWLKCDSLDYSVTLPPNLNISFETCPLSGKALGQFPDKITCGNIYQSPTNADTLFIMYKWEGYVQFITPKNKDCDFTMTFKCYNNVKSKTITPPLCTGYLTKYRRLTKKECKQLKVKKSKLKSFPMDYCD